MYWSRSLLNDFQRLQNELDSIFSGNFESSFSDSPLLNVYDKDDRIIVTAELSGVSKDDVNVTFNNKVLTIEGTKKEDSSYESMTKIRSERSVGSFEKRVTIPVEIEEDKIDASLENGVLTITLPKAEKAKPKRIAVNIK